METVKKGQTWVAKEGKRVLKIKGKATGNRHWTVSTNGKKSHHIHEGTLIKFYKLA